MTFNFAELQQKIDRLLYNIAEQNRRAYQLFYDPTPRDVQLPQLDENGNLITVTIPNRAKIRQEIWADAQSAMSKTFYVDAQNGSDDTGDGSQSAPFKTIKKAVESIPAGGYGEIYIIANNDIVIQETNIVFQNKHVIFRKLGDGNVTIKKLSERCDFTLFKSSAAFSGINFAGKEKDPSYNYDYNWVANFQLVDSTITAYDANISIDNGSFATGVDNQGYAGVFLYHCNITTTPDTVSVFRLVSDIGFYIFKAGSTIDDSSKHISGIIRDSNGVPRNIISNVIF